MVRFFGYIGEEMYIGNYLVKIQSEVHAKTVLLRRTACRVIFYYRLVFVEY